MLMIPSTAELYSCDALRVRTSDIQISFVDLWLSKLWAMTMILPNGRVDLEVTDIARLGNPSHKLSIM